MDIKSPNLVIGNGHWDRNFYNSFVKSKLLNGFDPERLELIVNLRLHFRSTVHDAVKQVASTLPGTVIPTGPSDFLIEGTYALAEMHFHDTQTPFDVEARIIDVELRGTVKCLKAFHENMQSFIHADEVYIHWWFKSGNDLKNIQFTLEDRKVFHSENYPYIPDVNGYFDRFTKSQASVLILLGEPGTGKTSFIRHLLRSSQSECMITYDEAVMFEDQLYINFLSNKSIRFLVLEDADLLLTERVQDNNKVMSKLLNTSDGLIPLNDKKVIFTANIHDASRIDEALRRPGRCFDVLNFRALNHAEASVIAESNGITLGTKSEYTLAEIFSQK